MTDLLFEHLFRQERELHKNEIRKNTKELNMFLDSGFYEFGSSGKILTREDIVNYLSLEEEEVEIESWNYNAKLLSNEIVLVTYISRQNKVEALRSSIWKKTGDKWLMVFHQGTKRE